MPELTALYPSRFLTAADLKGKEVTATISRVEIETFDDKEKPVIYFDGAQKGCVLNKTNAMTIGSIAGTNTDSWPGHRVCLFATMVNFGGQMKEAIRVRRAPDTAGAQQPAAQAADPLLNDGIPFS